MRNLFSNFIIVQIIQELGKRWKGRGEVVPWELRCPAEGSGQLDRQGIWLEVTLSQESDNSQSIPNHQQEESPLYVGQGQDRKPQLTHLYQWQNISRQIRKGVNLIW